MERKAKHVYESKTTQIQILMPRHINGYNRLFGGKLVEWIDVVAAVTARRHSGCNVTTACIDNLQFQSGAHANNTIVIEGQLTWVGRTSMEVRVDTFVEELDGKKTHINRAYLIWLRWMKRKIPRKCRPCCAIPTRKRRNSRLESCGQDYGKSGERKIIKQTQRLY